MMDSQNKQIAEDQLPEGLLADDERLTFSARPSVSVLMHRTRWVLWLVGLIVIVGPVLMWIFLGQLRQVAPVTFYSLIGLIVLADIIPVVFLYGLLHLQAGRLLYVMTDRRAMVIVEDKEKKYRTFTRAELAERRIERRGKAGGDIFFPNVQTAQTGGQMGWIGLAEVDEVDRRLAALAGGQSRDAGEA
ncbi:MAG: hypothetical protein ACLFUJ_12480 [Phycisphaerae bacterium]